MAKRVDPKNPASEEVFEFDCGSVMAIGDTIATVESVTVKSGDAGSLDFMTPPAASDDGQFVSLMIGGGLPASWYTLVCWFRTTMTGERLPVELEFYVEAE